MPLPSQIPVTVIVLTYNEQANIRACLSSLTQFAELVILDSGSTDRTLHVVKCTRPDARIFTHPFEDFGAQRNWAIDHTNPVHEWILFVDADERMTDECAQSIHDAVADPGGSVGFYLTYKNYFLGRPIPRCTLYPSWQLRLFHRAHVRFRAEGHGQREVCSGKLSYLRAPYEHYGFSHGIAHWIARHNRYSTEEAQLIQDLQAEQLRLQDLISSSPIVRRRCLKRLAARVGFRPWLRFIYLYVLRLGFLEGRAGLMFCLLRMAQEIHITAKLCELKHQLQQDGCLDQQASQLSNEPERYETAY